LWILWNMNNIELNWMELNGICIRIRLPLDKLFIFVPHSFILSPSLYPIDQNTVIQDISIYIWLVTLPARPGLLWILWNMNKIELHYYLTTLSLWYKLIRYIKKTPWSESESELYRPSDRRLWAKWSPNLQIEGAMWSAWRIPTAVFSVF
jgi:hypothetical protein